MDHQPKFDETLPGEELQNEPKIKSEVGQASSDYFLTLDQVTEHPDLIPRISEFGEKIKSGFLNFACCRIIFPWKENIKN